MRMLLARSSTSLLRNESGSRRPSGKASSAIPRPSRLRKLSDVSSTLVSRRSRSIRTPANRGRRSKTRCLSNDQCEPPLAVSRSSVLERVAQRDEVREGALEDWLLVAVEADDLASELVADVEA